MESGSNHRPGQRTKGSSHVNDAATVLFSGPPEPQTLLDDGDRYDGGLHPCALACPGRASEYGLEFLPGTIAIILVLYIPLIWIGLALSAKRLHDRDKSAWWLLVFYALPTILSTAADRTEDVQFITLHLISFGITVWAFVELGCLRGTVGSNRYGPDPLSAPA